VQYNTIENTGYVAIFSETISISKYIRNPSVMVKNDGGSIYTYVEQYFLYGQ
jgi:hypothetical protein